MCRVIVQAGGGPLSPPETALLGEADRRAGYHLACQVALREGLRIEIPPSYFQAREYRAQLIARRALTPDICELRLQLLDPPEMAFEAGQFVQIRIPPHGALRRTLYRPYSIASAPGVSGLLELEVKRVLNGTGSVYLCDRLPPDGRLVLNGPHGDFRLRPEPRNLLFVAGGSGMAPIKAMLLDMAARGDRRRARYFFGACAAPDLFLLHEMQALESRLADFRFIPVLAEPPDGWRGETGLVTDALARRLDPAAGGQTDVYLCGSPAMIAACVSLLRKRAFDPKRIFYDAFA